MRLRNSLIIFFIFLVFVTLLIGCGGGGSGGGDVARLQQTQQAQEVREREVTYQCSDNIDNDNDGLIDLSDPGCVGTTDNDESTTISIDLDNRFQLPEEAINPLPEGCVPIFQNGPTNEKINIYFYEKGFNSKPGIYDNYVAKSVAMIFGGSFNGEVFQGIEPFKSLKNEFNVFSYKDENNPDDTGCSLLQNCYVFTVQQELSENCAGFLAASDFISYDDNYNVFILPYDAVEGGRGGSMSVRRINSTTLRVGGKPPFYMNVNSPIGAIVHELGHRIGFFGDEYVNNLYPTAHTFYPNFDSFGCTKWCQGVDTQSECYSKYIQWLECFKTRFIDTTPEISEILTTNNIIYDIPGEYSWWGDCFNARNMDICGNRIGHIVLLNLNPKAYDPNSDQLPNATLVAGWEYCKNLNPDLAAPTGCEGGFCGCDLGLNCGGDGCYVKGSFVNFIPSRENKFMMGAEYPAAGRFNKHDEEILRHNILNKVRYIDVENIQYQQN